MRKRKITVRPSAAWYSDDIGREKWKRRKLERRFGINGKALHWFKSYLEERKQVVNVEGSTPHSKDLNWRVPQGAVLWPILYSYVFAVYVPTW